jgi:NADH dehydrogenase (ubiquinone) 1 alpha subcomplex subunit 6
MMKLHEINMPTSTIRAKVREEFERHRFVEELEVRDILYAKGQMEYQEIMNVWKQNNHIMNYFIKEELPPKPTTFLEKFYEGRS